MNHILGYGDLLLEFAGDSGNPTIAAVAEDILASGKTLATLVEKNLLTPAAKVDRNQMDALRNDVRPIIEKILMALASSPEPAAGNFPCDDMERIRIAANQLLMTVVQDETPSIPG